MPKAKTQAAVGRLVVFEALILTPVQLPRRQVVGSLVLVPVLVTARADEPLILVGPCYGPAADLLRRNQRVAAVLPGIARLVVLDAERLGSVALIPRPFVHEAFSTVAAPPCEYWGRT